MKLISLTAIAAVLLLFPKPTFAQAVDTVIALNELVSDEPIPAGDDRVIGVLIPRGATKVQFQIKAAKKTKLDIDVRLVLPDGTDIEAAAMAVQLKAKVKITSKGAKIVIPVLDQTGLYKLVMRSDKAEARPFQTWVTREVLPAVRKDGVYLSLARSWCV